MLDGYFTLPAWLRTIVALGVLVVGIMMVFSGYRGRTQITETPLPNGRVMVTEKEEPGARGLFRLGFVVTGVGAVLFMTCGKTRAESSGYNF